MADDDEIIRRRLLFDGDGTSEDRKINLVLKKFYKWCNLDPFSDEGQAACNQVLGMLGQCEFAYAKSRCIRQMTEAECREYEKIRAETAEEFEAAKEEVASVAEKFRQADGFRKNNNEYEARAKNIKKLPDRKTTQRRLYKLNNDIYQYKDKLTKLEQKLDKRRKQMRIVMNSLQQMQHLVEEDITEANDDPNKSLSNATLLKGTAAKTDNKEMKSDVKLEQTKDIKKASELEKLQAT